MAGRSEFRKMLADIKSGKDSVDYVLVFKLSRFGRNTADILNHLKYIQDYRMNLLCVEDNIDSAATSGKLMISVLAAVMKIEHENTKEHTMAGRKQKQEMGCGTVALLHTDISSLLLMVKSQRCWLLMKKKQS